MDALEPDESNANFGHEEKVFYGQNFVSIRMSGEPHEIRVA